MDKDKLAARQFRQAQLREAARQILELAEKLNVHIYGTKQGGAYIEENTKYPLTQDLAGL